jgi:hypothetical protein
VLWWVSRTVEVGRLQLYLCSLSHQPKPIEKEATVRLNMFLGFSVGWPSLAFFSHRKFKLIISGIMHSSHLHSIEASCQIFDELFTHLMLLMNCRN